MFYFFLIFKNVKTIVTSQLCKNRLGAGFGPQAVMAGPCNIYAFPVWQALFPYLEWMNPADPHPPDEVDLSVVSLLQLGKLSLGEIQLLT